MLTILRVWQEEGERILGYCCVVCSVSNKFTTRKLCMTEVLLSNVQLIFHFIFIMINIKNLCLKVIITEGCGITSRCDRQTFFIHLRIKQKEKISTKPYERIFSPYSRMYCRSYPGFVWIFPLISLWVFTSEERYQLLEKFILICDPISLMFAIFSGRPQSVNSSFDSETRVQGKLNKQHFDSTNIKIFA